MTETIRYIDPETEEVKSIHGRVIGVLSQGGPVKHRVAVIDRGKSEMRIPEYRLVDKSVLDRALVV